MSTTTKTLEELSNKETYLKQKLSKDKLKKLGITELQSGKYKTLKEVLEKDSVMVIGQCIENIESIKKGEAYVMALGVFQSAKTPNGKKIFKPYRHPFTKYFKRYKGQDLNNKKLLIWRTGGLGDLVIIQSVLKALKKKFPSVKITFATSHNFITLFNSFPFGLVDKAISIPFSKKELEEHDYHMTFINSIENCQKTNTMNYFDIFQKVSGIEYNPDEYMSTLHPIKILEDRFKTIIPRNTVMIHMASSTKLRTMDPLIWLNVIKLLNEKGYNVGIIDSPNVKTDIDKFIVSTGLDRMKVFNLANVSETINHGIAMANCCVGGLCIDSVYTHVFGALNKPAICICGPYTSYNVVGKYKSVKGFDPPKEWNECGKYPCHLNSQEHQCPFLLSGRPPGCLSCYTPEYIVEKFEEMLNVKK